MVPRADIEAVEIDTTLGELLTVFEQSGHSRMPVYSETLDDPRGMVHIRDVLAHITKLARAKKGRGDQEGRRAATLDLANVDLTKTIGDLNLIRTVLFVPPSMLASDLMARMQATRTQMALVIDEYGGTDGLVSLEDIVEMVVGDIEDEHDDEEPMITQAGDGVFVVDGKAEIDDVAKLIGEDFTAGEHGEYVDTIGGMIFNTLGRVPARGEVVQAIPGFEFHVLDADPRRVKRVRIVHILKAERRRRAALASTPSRPIERDSRKHQAVWNRQSDRTAMQTSCRVILLERGLRMERLAGRIILLWGWRRSLAAPSPAGALAVLTPGALSISSRPASSPSRCSSG